MRNEEKSTRIKSLILLASKYPGGLFRILSMIGNLTKATPELEALISHLREKYNEDFWSEFATNLRNYWKKEKKLIKEIERAEDKSEKFLIKFLELQELVLIDELIDMSKKLEEIAEAMEADRTELFRLN